jgi:hypothetical protein
MLTDLKESLEKLMPMLKGKGAAAELALQAEIVVREFSGLPPVELDDRDTIAILKSVCLLLERFQRYPELLNQQENTIIEPIKTIDPVEINILIESPPIPTTVREISTQKPSATAQELIKLRDWVLLAKNGDRQEQASDGVLDGIYERLGGILEQEGMITFQAAGKFNYERQKIVSTQVTDDDSQEDLIYDTVRPGYLFNEILIRPQEVIVYTYSDPN